MEKLDTMTKKRDAAARECDNLALSLHAPNQHLRESIMPAAGPYPLREPGVSILVWFLLWQLPV